MIGVENQLVHNDADPLYEDEPSMDCNTNISNFCVTSSISVARNEEARVDTLEKSIAFLRQQHERMLKGLQDEIENLRRANKALQFRLVMCCCQTSAYLTKPTENTCSVSSSDLKNEVAMLKRLLEEERSKNNLLTQQIESMRSAKQIEPESQKAATPRSARKSNREHEDGNVRVSDKGLYERRTTPTSNKKRGSLRKDRHQTEVSETEKPAQPGQLHRGSTTSRIRSPDLNLDSSSSAILLTPRTSINPPDGFWVRPSIVSLQNKLLPFSFTDQRDSGVHGNRITPVKLPIIKNSTSMNQVRPDVEEFPVATMDIPARENSNRTFMTKGINVEFTQSRTNLPTRQPLRHNSTAVCDPLRELPVTTPREDVHHSLEYFSDRSRPFLPALPKSGDDRRAERTLLAKEIHRKCSNQAHNSYPS